MKKSLLIVSLSVTALASCGPKVFRSEAVPAQVDRVVLFEPMAYISYISRGNQPVLNDSMSRIASLLAESVLLTGQGMPAINRKISFDDPVADNLYREEIDALYTTLSGSKGYRYVPVPPMIDSLMDASGERFGMLVLISGFTRRSGNYAGQIAKGAGIQVATMLFAAALGGGVSVGMYPNKAGLKVGVAIVDNDRKEIAFFDRFESTDSDSEPMEEEAIRKHIEKVFKNYYK